ncbi:LysR family transcriptional regulator ArgP [Phaeovulum sp. NW3]|uniref:LysR family transcriptional regulator ArgP n=1 Tax=Phaeovulum sp. NW3 TaxID=2934933 RepID=UPI00202201EE|nr:LysR family transcriptional regulator ArgP [Phaeovulum sp. NW3]MCL7464977.1 LysR family transcriptional regulator ArgP [Phaeovulum sp. NW3]
MLDYPALAALAEVLRRGSFEAAAAALHVTPSAISQRIRALEDRMGCVLVRRGTPCTGTETGLRLARHLQQVRLLERDLAAPDAAATTPVIRLAVNADSLATWVLPALAACAGMLFDLVIDDQDHSDDWLRRGEVLAAVTAAPGPVAGCDSLPLGRLRYIATASPAFVARHFPDGPTAQALMQAPAITFNHKDRLQIDWARQISGGTAGPPIAPPTHQIASSQGFVEAALLGLGWGMNPEPLIRDHLAAGRLVALAPAPLDVSLHWQALRRMRGPLAPLTRAIRAAAAQVLLPP